MLDYAEICSKLQNVRKTINNAEICGNGKLCGNVWKTVNCVIPHPSQLIGVSVNNHKIKEHRLALAIIDNLK